MDDGQNKLIPYIDGSTKEDIAKWFDFVFYTTASLNAKGETEYFWITSRTEKYDHAKDRTQLLPRKIPQDYQLPIEAARSKGFDGVKILVIGSPGSGKTFALRTLIPNVESALSTEEVVQEHTNGAITETETSEVTA